MTVVISHRPAAAGRLPALRTLSLAALAALALLLAGCAGQGVSGGAGGGEGVAAYYGNEFNGRRTASGERFDPSALTAAHRTLAFGTRVRVTNRNNGRQVVVRINDRGPFTKGRIIDLSPAAARKLDMIKSGVAPVRLDVLD